MNKVERERLKEEQRSLKEQRRREKKKEREENTYEVDWKKIQCCEGTSVLSE